MLKRVVADLTLDKDVKDLITTSTNACYTAGSRPLGKKTQSGLVSDESAGLWDQPVAVLGDKAKVREDRSQAPAIRHLRITSMLRRERVTVCLNRAATAESLVQRLTRVRSSEENEWHAKGVAMARTIHVLCATVVAIVATGRSANATTIRYTINELRSPAGLRISAGAMNNSGQVAGSLTTPAGETRAVLWQSGTLTDLGPGGAFAINDKGEVAGTFTTPSHEVHAFIWRSATGRQDLGKFENQPEGLSDSGQMFVNAYDSASIRHAFVWQPGTGMQELTPSLTSFAADINSSGQVLGTYSPNGLPQPFIWQHGSGVQEVPVGSAIASAINDMGDVAGYFYDPPGVLGVPRAFLWRNGQG
ncbi:MAG TPA: hypothetical protein VES20_18615, partial [Bryobacteraceae bacterium]|nr:hypothetical protein [Bryobacteraceae bacterium]